MKALSLPLCVIVALLLQGCSREAVPVRYGKDECALCKMTLVDQRFGAELITPKGKVLLFDDLTCLFQYQQANPQQSGVGAQIYVVDFAHPGKLVAVDQSVYLAGGDIHSPMGSAIAAFGSTADREATRPQLGKAKPYGWSDLPRTP